MIKMNILVNKVLNAIREQKREIYEAISKDYKENQLQIQYGLLEEVLLNINNETKNSAKTILCIYNGNTYIMLEVVIKSIINSNNIVLISEGVESYTHKILIDIIKHVLLEEKCNLIVKEYNDVDITAVLEKDGLIDRIIFLGDKRRFRQMKQKTTIELLYNGYGSINVYVDDEDEYENELFEIEQYAYTNNYYIYKYTDGIDEDIKQMNKDANNEICIILSKDEKKINKFKSKIKSNRILVNQVDLNFKYALPENLFK